MVIFARDTSPITFVNPTTPVEEILVHRNNNLRQANEMAFQSGGLCTADGRNSGQAEKQMDNYTEKSSSGVL